MASIKFYPYAPKGTSKVYVRLTVKRGSDFRLSTGLTIKDAKAWSSKTNYPKTTETENKILNYTLKGLKKHIEDKILLVEQSQSEGIDSISSKWLKNIILDYFNEPKTKDSQALIPYAWKFVDSLSSSTYRRNGQRLPYTQNTIDKYKNFVRQLESFEQYLKRPIDINHVDEDFTNSFLAYLTDQKDLSINTKGRFVKRLKTIIADSEVNGKIVNPKYKLIKGFEDVTIVTYLNFEELDKIVATKMPTDRLKHAKNWLIIGCYTAQRISDLFRMRKEMIVEHDGMKYIVLKQFKTSKKVMIPIHYRVENVLKQYGNDFPPNFHDNEKSNRTTLSSLMKEVCELACINDTVKGRYNGVIGYYPKYKLIQNHTCRRSFATNFYGLKDWTTPMIMEITGHETEKNFKKYIDREDFTLSQQAAKNFAKMKEDNCNKKTALRVS
ncbi:phage integrase SAM-like domain-containing protein [Zobellia roscoffensis]|uniref:phage integrase SAM-like domain-containing protein n=1 Tax=Zobellia roscoffensis TaxID=2779508 RepID=UPI001889CEEA|nr:phage integrase SAM-like domain-containing protein [Zobellia roscoffensis]